MANIFNLFGGISEVNKDPIMKPLIRSKTSLGINEISLKNVSGSKPKGLSIRSHSDLNVPTTIQDNANKKQELLKLKPTQLDNDGQVISPRKHLSSKKLIGSPKKTEDVSPKEIFDTKSIKLPLSCDETIFKKPLPLKNNIKKSYPEPESLAPYCDMQFEFDNIYTKSIKNEFEELLMKMRNAVQPYEDEGFDSDPEQIDFKVPELIMSPEFDKLQIECKTHDLPEISDDDDNFLI